MLVLQNYSGTSGTKFVCLLVCSFVRCAVLSGEASQQCTAIAAGDAISRCVGALGGEHERGNVVEKPLEGHAPNVDVPADRVLEEVRPGLVVHDAHEDGYQLFRAVSASVVVSHEGVKVAQVVEEDHLEDNARVVVSPDAAAAVGVPDVCVEALVCELVQPERLLHPRLVIEPQGAHVVDDCEVENEDEGHRRTHVVIPKVVPAGYLQELIVQVATVGAGGIFQRCVAIVTFGILW